MHKKIIPTILSLALVLTISSVFATDPTPYHFGVHVGETLIYLIQGNGGCPGWPEQPNPYTAKANMGYYTVTSISGPRVTFQVTLHSLNGKDAVTWSGYIDLSLSNNALDGFILLPANIPAGTVIPIGSVSTTVKSALGFDYINVVTPTASLKLIWKQSTGVSVYIEIRMNAPGGLILWNTYTLLGIRG